MCYIAFNFVEGLYCFVISLPSPLLLWMVFAQVARILQQKQASVASRKASKRSVSKSGKLVSDRWKWYLTIFVFSWSLLKYCLALDNLVWVNVFLIRTELEGVGPNIRNAAHFRFPIFDIYDVCHFLQTMEYCLRDWSSHDIGAVHWKEGK